MSGATEGDLAAATSVQSLASVLEEELRILLRIRDIAQDEKAILSSGRPDALWNKLSELEASWQELHRAEDRRQLLARRLSEHAAAAGEETALQEVVSALPPEMGGPLRQLRTDISAVVADIAELNAQNATVITGLLQLTGQRLQFFTALQAGYQPYDACGKRTGVPADALQGGRLA